MTVFDKARELGDLIIQTDEAIARNETRERFLQDTDAVEKMEGYEHMHRSIQRAMQDGKMTDEEFKEATLKLTKLGTELKLHPIAGAYITAVNDFNLVVNQVFQIIQNAAMGEQEGCGCGCDGECDCDGECECGGHGDDECNGDGSCGCGHHH